MVVQMTRHGEEGQLALPQIEAARPVRPIREAEKAGDRGDAGRDHPRPRPARELAVTGHVIFVAMGVGHHQLDRKLGG